MCSLIEDFSNESPLRPLDIFCLNRSSAASHAGLMITYLIVLLQFKQGE